MSASARAAPRNTHLNSLSCIIPSSPCALLAKALRIARGVFMTDSFFDYYKGSTRLTYMLVA
jgi:hypothetical protein